MASLTHKLLAASVMATLSTTALAALDVAGIKTGVPFAAQRALLSKANPQFKITDIKLRNGKTVGVEAVAERDGKPFDHMVVAYTDSGVVWYVARGQSLPQGGRIKEDVLIASMKEKYGPVTDNVGTTSQKWTFDRSGKLRPANTPGLDPCVHMNAGNGASFQKVSGAYLTVPTSFAPGCGMEIRSWLTGDSNEKMVSSFAVTMIDNKLMYDELNGKDVQAEQERKKKLDAEKSRDIKPQL